MRRTRKLMAAQAERIIDLEDALVELHGFVVNELDPDPCPIEAYFGPLRLQKVARSALFRVHSRSLPDGLFGVKS